MQYAIYFADTVIYSYYSIGVTRNASNNHLSNSLFTQQKRTVLSVVDLFSGLTQQVHCRSRVMHSSQDTGGSRFAGMVPQLHRICGSE